MSVYVLTLEKSTETTVLSIHMTEKAAKVAAAEFVGTGEYKKKQSVKDSEKKLLFQSADAKLVMSSVAFEMPVQEQTSGKSKKVKKDPNAPKKGLSAFMLFSRDKRTELKAAKPEVTFAEMGKLLGLAWKELSDKQREVYVKMAEEDKVRYTSDLETYVSASVAPSVVPSVAA
jgi:leucyl aminopeptidase (aminopeptidase T)